MHPFVELAKNAVEMYIRERKTIEKVPLAGATDERAGVFVTIRINRELRGCIGTISPLLPNLAEEIINNAISAATMDPRFSPISQKELPALEYSVDVLEKPEEVFEDSLLDPKKYGLIVECGRRKGLLLPDIEGVNTIEQQKSICRQKAGIMPNEEVKILRFQVRRYK